MGSSFGGKADSVSLEQKGRESKVPQMIHKDYQGESKKEQEKAL